MRYTPYEDEYAAVPGMTDEELLEYFLYRVLETDEVWALKEGSQWIRRELDGRETFPVWPYKRYADEAAVGDWQSFKPVADTVEFFLYQTLNKLALQNVLVEIMPRTTGPGSLVSPQRLFNFLEEMKNSREFVLDD